MIYKDNMFIIKNRKFTKAEIESIVTDYIEQNKIKSIIERKTKHCGESLIEFCKRVYYNEQSTCDNYYSLFIKVPYTYKGIKIGRARQCFSDITITELLKDSDKWKDYIIKSVHYGYDCSINVFAELPCKTVNDLIYYCGHNINNDCIFKEVLGNTEYTLDYVKTHNEEFENTVFVYEVDVDEDKKIIYVHYMKNNGN